MKNNYAQILRNYGANSQEIEELITYNQNHFNLSQITSNLTFPLPSESHLTTWKSYINQAQTTEVFTTLSSYLIQLQFPIQAGISHRN